MSLCPRLLLPNANHINDYQDELFDVQYNTYRQQYFVIFSQTFLKLIAFTRLPENHLKHRRLYLIAYDISSHDIRRQALRICRKYATGGQRSIHECWLSDGEYGDVLADLSLIIDPESDRITSVLLDGRQPVHTLGRATEPLNPTLLVVA